jgi:hypothetical protein
MELARKFRINPRPAIRYAKQLPSVPEGAEGWFAILSPSAIEKLVLAAKTAGKQHWTGLDVLSWEFARSKGSGIGRYTAENSPTMTKHTTEKLQWASQDQPGDILIIGAQLGMRYQGRSVSAARDAFTEREFGLDSVSAGTILLTHLERLSRPWHLALLCTGDECRSDHENSEPNVCAPFFFAFHPNSIHLSASTKLARNENLKLGPVSGFVP